MQKALMTLLRGVCALPGPARIKLFITSRMDDWIQRTFVNALPDPSQQAQNVRLHELAHAEVESDIRMYYEDTFARIRRDHPDGPRLTSWPTAEEKTLLIGKTGVLFVYASTVCRFLRDHRLSPRKKLSTILRVDTDDAVAYPYQLLDNLYLKVLSDSVGDDRDPSHAALIQRVVATVTLAAVPVTIDTLSDIIGDDAHAVVRTLSSVLLVPERSLASEEPVRAFHPSFHDFLTNKNRCTDPRFVVNTAAEHSRLAARCFEHMQGGLKQDVCDIHDPSMFNLEVPDLQERIARHLPLVVRYSCLYWHFHLGLASNSDPELSALYVWFCRKRLLFSIEAASLLGKLGTTQSGLMNLQSSCPVRPERVTQPPTEFDVRLILTAPLPSS
jgi:hypothetical protein